MEGLCGLQAVKAEEPLIPSLMWNGEVLFVQKHAIEQRTVFLTLPTDMSRLYGYLLKQRQPT